MTLQTLRHLPANELREGDWPISIAGFRPIQRIRKFPRKRQIAVWIDGQRYTLPADNTIGKVRRAH